MLLLRALKTTQSGFGTSYHVSLAQRKPSSGKFFRNSEFKGKQLSNLAYHSNQQIYVAAGNTIYSFDTRKEGPILNEIANRSTNHLDDINHVAFSNDFKFLSACDDEGDCSIYNEQLERSHLLDQ